MIHLRDLQVVKGNHVICHIEDLEVQAGERVVLLGNNGTGKSTLLRVLAGLERHDRGTLHIETPLPQRVYVHQTPFLFRGTVTFNVGYGLTARGIDGEQKRRTVTHWMEMFQIAHLAARSCEKLSGGERRRVALARAFAVGADLLLLDEPLADLDDKAIESFPVAVDKLDKGATLLIASPLPLPATFNARIVEMAPPSSNA